MELGVSICVLSVFGAFLDIAQGNALVAVGVGVAFRAIARTAAEKEVMTKADTSHGVFMIGSRSAWPAADVLEEHSVIMPVDWSIRLKEWKHAEAVQFGAEFMRDLSSCELADRREKIQVGRKIVHHVWCPVSSPAPVGKCA